VGEWTIGWGTTSADKGITGKSIKAGMKISQATADDWLRKAVNSKYAPMVEAYDKQFCWSQAEFDALCSFAYNLGHLHLLHEGGDPKKPLRSRAEIRAAWCKWDKAGGRHVKGLLERREAELKLFNAASPSPGTGGNPYPAPTKTITSNEQALALGLVHWQNHGDEVKAVQWELVRLGYSIGSVDGICGKKTITGVITFQLGAGLKADGACGAQTWEALTKAKEKPKPTVAPTDTAKVTAPTNYRKAAAEAAKRIYPLAKGKKHGSGVQKRVTTLEEFKRQGELNCHLMASLVLQEAGCLPKGKVITHTKKASGKEKITDAVRGTENLKHCKVYWVNKKFSELPEEWKKAGCVYIQNSNACVSAGDGDIWSCNKSVGEQYNDPSDWKKKKGYVVTSDILVVIVPEEG
jgi:GH24 family phage-related lysozyme (muramidase)